MLRPVQALLLISALCIVALGLLVSGAGILSGLVGPPADRLLTVTLGASFLILAVGLGLMLAWHAWQSLQGRASAPFRPRRIWVWGVLYPLVLLIGQIILSLDLLPAFTFPLFHVAAGALPPLIVLSLVGRSLGGAVRRREMVFQVSSGAFLATSLAFTIELAIILGLALAAFTAVAARPGGLDLLQALATRLEDPTWLQDPARLLGLAKEPVILATISLVAVVVIPLVEEAIKTVGVGLLAWQRPGPARAFMWGLAGGAGFALTENLLNTAGSLDAWVPVAILRLGATLLHCFTGGLMGLAWYQIVGRRNLIRTAGLYAASVGVHAAWNGLAAGLTVISLATQPGPVDIATQTWAGVGIATVLALLVGLAVVVGLGLMGLVAFLGRHHNR